MEKVLLTAAKKAELEAELQHRKSVLRAEIGEQVQTARAHGDLSENAEYHAARDEQGKNESRIMEIEDVLKRAVIIERSGSGKGELGASVTLQRDGDGGPKTYTLVSPQEADMAQGRLSIDSPLGKCVIGKGSGDVCVIETPKGEAKYNIISID